MQRSIIWRNTTEASKRLSDVNSMASFRSSASNGLQRNGSNNHGGSANGIAIRPSFPKTTVNGYHLPQNRFISPTIAKPSSPNRCNISNQQLCCNYQQAIKQPIYKNVSQNYDNVLDSKGLYDNPPCMKYDF